MRNKEKKPEAETRSDVEMSEQSDDNSSTKPHHRKTARTKTISETDTPSASEASGGASEVSEEEVVEAPPTNTPGVVHHQIATRLSTGSLGRKSRREPSSPPLDSPTKKQGKVSTENAEPETRIRRQWELWSVEDKNVFFEAINEHGKDFDAIQAALTSKQKKKGGDVKSKNQVRHFYYRTCQNIIKVINLSQYEQEGISRQALELYGLINYGELRKKLSGKLDQKNAERLNELIFKGCTIVKVKGKKYHRIKTPTCKALKKLNHMDDQKDDAGSKIAVSFLFELKPLNNKAWTHVQSLAHNPRLRINIKPNRSLAAIFDYLHRKWLPRRVRQRSKFDLPTEDLMEEVRLHLTPDSHLAPFRVKVSNSALKTELDFNHFLQRTKDWSHAEISTSPATKKGQRLKEACNRVPSQMDDGDSGSEIDENLQTDKIKRLMAGISRQDALDIKTGELFFMLGNPPKVTFEYEWIALRPQVTPDLLDFNAELSNMLRRLVHLANPEFSDIRKPKISTSSPPSQCTCGAAKSNTPPQKRSLKTSNNVSVRPFQKSPNMPKNGQNPILPKPDSKSANSDAVFRVPTTVPLRAKPSPDSMDTTENIVARHIESFIPKRQRRVPRKRPQEVVQRTLLPKAQTPQRQIMTLAILGPTSPSTPAMRVVASPAYAIQENALSEQTPPEKPRNQPRRIIPTPIPKNSESGTFPPESIVRTSQAASTEMLTTDVPKTKPSMPMFAEMDSFLAESSVPMHNPTQINGSHSPSSMSSFLDLSLPTAPDGPEGAEKYLSLSLDNTSNSFSALLEAPSQPKKDDPSRSSNKVYKTSEDQWITPEDFSLSQLFEGSPLKKQKIVITQPEIVVQTSNISECSRDSLKLDVDSTLQCMLNENSLEYVSKFADLAAQIAAQGEQLPTAAKGSCNTLK